MRKNLTHALIIAIFIMVSYSIAKPFIADHYYKRGLDIESKEWVEAVASYSKAISLDPANAEYHNKLGHIYLIRARLQPSVNNNLPPNFLTLAEQSYKKAIELCPKNGNHWIGLGMVYEQTGKFKAQSSKLKEEHNGQPSTGQLAADCYQKAISLDPNNAFFRTMLGSFYIRNGNKQEGLKEYEKAITSLPKIYLYDFLKGKDVKDEFLDAAVRGLKKAIELYPKNADIYHELGSIYIKKRMYAEAIGQYEQALKLKPDHKGFKKTLESLKKQHSSQ